MCLPDYVASKVSAILLQLAPTARPEQVKFAISQLADVKVVEGNGVLTSSRQALSTLFVGIAAFAALVGLSLLILVSLLFTAIVQERTREIGLLRAMGARPGHVVAMVLAEAAMVDGAWAGSAGIVLGFALLLAFAARLASISRPWASASAGRRSMCWPPCSLRRPRRLRRARRRGRALSGVGACAAGTVRADPGRGP